MTVDADKSGRITAIELQQALVNANWSHFNPETCRLMIGELKLHDFLSLYIVLLIVKRFITLILMKKFSFLIPSQLVAKGT